VSWEFRGTVSDASCPRCAVADRAGIDYLDALQIRGQSRVFEKANRNTPSSQSGAQIPVFEHDIRDGFVGRMSAPFGADVRREEQNRPLELVREALYALQQCTAHRECACIPDNRGHSSRVYRRPYAPRQLYSLGGATYEDPRFRENRLLLDARPLGRTWPQSPAAVVGRSERIKMSHLA